MVRTLLLFTAGLAGCSNDAAVLSGLQGNWLGAVETDVGRFPATGAFLWDETQALLTGNVVVTETVLGAQEVHTYAVRRWDVLQQVSYLDMTDVADATRGLDWDGEVEGEGVYRGDATVTYPCPEGDCGYIGKFEMALVPTPATPTTASGTAR
jgi:hypothetical protein